MPPDPTPAPTIDKCSVAGCGRAAPLAADGRRGPCLRCKRGRLKVPVQPIPDPTRRTRLEPPAATETPWTLVRLGRPAITFAAAGVPAPQGSKKHVGDDAAGRAILVESSKKVRPWRAAVTAAASAALPSGWVPLDGPLIADMIFTLPKGPSLPKWLAWHERYPDLSKLARSTEDALTVPPGGTWPGVWADDARVTAYRRLDKVFEGADDPDALPVPGVVVRVWPVPEIMVERRKFDVRQGASQLRNAAPQ